LPAETIGRLNQKFFGRRAETIVKSLLPESRVFSKNFMRQMPDGTTQVSGWSEAPSAPRPFDELRANGLKNYEFDSKLISLHACEVPKKITKKRPEGRFMRSE
jgi:hypothetical protein